SSDSFALRFLQVSHASRSARSIRLYYLQDADSKKMESTMQEWIEPLFLSLILRTIQFHRSSNHGMSSVLDAQELVPSHFESFPRLLLDHLLLMPIHDTMTRSKMPRVQP